MRQPLLHFFLTIERRRIVNADDFSNLSDRRGDEKDLVDGRVFIPALVNEDLLENLQGKNQHRVAVRCSEIAGFESPAARLLHQPL